MFKLEFDTDNAAFADNCAGGAYGYQHWAVLSLHRDSDPHELAEEAAQQIEDLTSQ